MKLKRTATLFDPQTGSRMMTLQESADYLNYHPISLFRPMKEGILKPRSRAGKTLLFMQEDLDRFRLTSTWAARKSTIKKPLETPEKPVAKLEAAISLNMGSSYDHCLDPIKNFTWDQVPLIRARINNKYGNIPFDIEVKSPDGGLWSVEYQPPTWIEKLGKTVAKFFKRRLKK